MPDSPAATSAALAVTLLESIMTGFKDYETEESVEISLPAVEAAMKDIFLTDDGYHVPQIIIHLANLLALSFSTAGSSLAQMSGSDSEELADVVTEGFKKKLLHHYLQKVQETTEFPDAAIWVANVAADVDTLLNEGSS